ncbi:hypothetical protein [Streptomyces sp. NPDC088762]|uniref:hypothetical protein n=1 Tax=Streptomyces sp. NPDC088762 TaxID=3365891 RepID=UPI003806CAD1
MAARLASREMLGCQRHHLWLVGREPAGLFVVFDVLQIDGQELLHLPYVERRAHLEALFADYARRPRGPCAR